MMDTKKPQLRGFSAKGLTTRYLCLYSVVASYKFSVPKVVPFCHHLYHVVQVRLFRASKKTSISGEPASPIADSIPGCERIKTDYNSYLYTWRSLIDFNDLRDFVRLARGMVVSNKNLKAS